jgi:hypothetical protein
MGPWFWLFMASTALQAVCFTLYLRLNTQQEARDWKRLVVGEIVSIDVSNRLHEGVVGTVTFRDLGWRMQSHTFRPETREGK